MTIRASYFFSVIIPTYNRLALLAEAIESVLNQTYRDFELIVVDDGSTDETSEMIRSVAPRDFKYLRQEHLGVSAARNNGARAAKGNYLAFLDSDDLWFPEKLEKQADFFSEHPDSQVCHTGEIWIRNGRRIYPKKKHQKSGGFIFNRAVELCIVSPSSIAIKKEIFSSVGGFDKKLPAAEDYDLWLRLLSRYPIGFIKEPLVVKRAGDWQQLSTATEAIDRYRIKALCKILESGELTPEQSELARQALKKKCNIYIKGCEKRGKRAEANHFRKLLTDTMDSH